MADNNEEKKEQKVSDTSTEALAFLSIIAKNFLYIPKIMGDTNKTRNNIVKLVKLRGGESTEKADKSFLQEDSAEVQLQKQKDKYEPTPVRIKKSTKDKPKEKSIGIFGKIFNIFKTLKSLFSIGNIIKLIAGVGLITTILSYFWDSIIEAWEEWKESSGIWEAITEGLDTVKNFFVNLIGKETIDDITKKVKDFLKPVTDAVGGFFDNFSGWFSEKFDVVRNFLGIPIPEKKIKPKNIEIPIPEPESKEDSIGLAIAKAQEEQAKAQAEEARIQEKREAEVRAAYEKEEAVRYHGEDEIVRHRIGLQEKSAKKMAEEYGIELQDGKPKPATQQVKPTQSVTPTPAPEVKKETTPRPAAVSQMPQSTPGPLGQLLNMIAGKESRGLYDIVYGGERIPEMLNMSINQVISLQGNAKNDKRFGKGSSAAGKYQMMPYVIKEEAPKAGLNPNTDKFSPENQDKMIVNRMKRLRGFDKFMSGALSVYQFAKNLAMEFASFPVLEKTKGQHRLVDRGQSFYSGDNLNKSLISPDSVEAVLTEIKGGKQTSAAGQSISTASTEVASGQRKQQAANAPVIINSPTTNNTNITQTVQQKQAAPPYSSSTLIARQT